MGALSATSLLVWATVAAAGSVPLASDATAPDGTPRDAPSIWRSEEWTDLSGRRWTSEDLDGAVVVLDFWATWCAPCLAEMPNLRRLEAAHRERGLVLVGIALDTIDRRRLHSFLLRHEVTWPQVHVRLGFGGEVARRFGVETVPATLLVDRQGRIVARDLRGRALEAAVEALLDVEHEPSRSSSR